MSGTVTSPSFLGDLVAWLNRRFAPPGTPIGADTELFAGRLIDSIRVLELIAWTETALGKRIPDRMIRLENFRTPRTIRDVFATEVTNDRG